MSFNIWKYLDSIGNKELLEMASPKKDLEMECDRQTNTIFKHILLIGVYQDSLKALEHWANEIAIGLDSVNSYITKGTRSGKLKKEEYKLRVFLHFGDDVTDIKNRIKQFRHDYCKPDKYSDNPYIRISQSDKNKVYPYFEVDEDIVVRTFKFYIALAERASEVLSRKNDYNTINFKNLVLEVYCRYCK